MNINVTNLNFRVTEQDLRTLFSKFGKVNAARLVLDKVTGHSCGFAFVTMDSEEEGKKAIVALNDTEMYGLQMNVVENKSSWDNRSQFAISDKPWQN